jgi:hypothetical protein
MTRTAIVATFAILLANLCLAQDVTGNWAGVLLEAPGAPAVLNGGLFMRLTQIVVGLSKGRNGELKGVIYGGAKEEFALECTSISLTGSKLSFTIKGLPLNGAMSFVGTLSDDGNSIEGWLSSYRLKLQRVGRARNANSPSAKVDAPPPAPEASPTAPEASPATAPPGSNAEPSAILSRALAKLAGTGQRLLQYTCRETIERTYYSEPVGKLGTDLMTEAPTHANSCDGREFSTDGHLTLDMEDRLRLDVAVAGGKEIHSWASASRFDSRSVYDLVRNGPKSTGAFGTVLIDIFENPGAHYTFLGRKSEGSRDFLDYAFDVSLDASHFLVSAGNDWKKTAYFGSFEIDAATSELARVSLETAELATDTQMCRLRTVTDYHYAQIGNRQFLIPRQSQFDTVSPNASETHSVTTFTACHEYTAESSLVFDGPAPAASEKAAPKTAPPLPPGISLTLALTGPIDVGAAAAGDAVSARVTKAVRAPGSREILIAAGAIAHGRILNMQHRYASSQFQYSVRYDTLEQNGTVAPLTIELEREVKVEQRARNGFVSRGTEFSLSPVAATGETGSWFAISAGRGGYVIPADFESKWVTVGTVTVGR